MRLDEKALGGSAIEMKENSQPISAWEADDVRGGEPAAAPDVGDAFRASGKVIRRGPHSAPTVPAGSAWEILAEGIADGILAADTNGLVVAHNRRFHDLWGLDKEIVIGCSLQSVAALVAERLVDPCGFTGLRLAASSEHGQLFRLKDGRILEGRLAAGMHNSSRNPRTGSEPPAMGSVQQSWTSPDADMSAAVSVWSFRDVTERERAMQRTSLLAEAGRLLISLDLDATLEAVARSALPLLGELCAVDRISNGKVDRYLEVRTEPAAWLEPPEVLMSSQATEVRSEPARSRLTVPIVLHGVRCGALSVVTRAPAAYGEREQALAEELADRVALAMDSAEQHRRAREQLAEREQMMFVAAHELRSPLASLRIAVETLRRKQPSGARLERLLEVIDRDERRLTRMIGELLDLGRIRSGQLDLELDTVDMADVVHEVVARTAGDIARSGSPLSVHTSGPVVGRWDRSRLDQVVTNLLTNATKYGRGQPIEVHVDTFAGPNGRRARLSVIDHGSGIAPETQVRMFEPFARGPGLRESGGLGLGLYIVQTIVQRLGGEVRAESVPGHGATFTVELPLIAAASSQ
jgi:signal transduction histidine kinase